MCASKYFEGKKMRAMLCAAKTQRARDLTREFRQTISDSRQIPDEFRKYYSDDAINAHQAKRAELGQGPSQDWLQSMDKKLFEHFRQVLFDCSQVYRIREGGMSYTV